MRSARWRSYVVAIVSVVAALGSRVALAQGPIPCSLLTSAQVSAALGTSVGEGQPIFTKSCGWSAKSKGGLPRATVMLIDPTTFSKLKKPIVGPTKVPLSGVGDDAVYDVTDNFTVLSVKKGNNAFSVRLYGVNDAAKRKEVEKTLALDVAKKL